MGLITSVLPILYILAKPAVGYLMDYFPVNDTKFVDAIKFFAYQLDFVEHSKGHIHCNYTHNDAKLCWILHSSHAS